MNHTYENDHTRSDTDRPASARRWTRVASLILVAAAAPLLFVACSSSGGSSSSSTSASASPSATTSPACAELQSLQKAVTNLSNVQPTLTGVVQLPSAISAVTLQSQQLSAAAKALVAPQLAVLTTTVGALSKTLTTLSSDGIAGALPTLGTQILAVGTAATGFKTAVTTACP